MPFTRLTDAAKHLPSLCAVCHGWGTRRVCGACIARFGTPRRRCQRCALCVPDGVNLCGACVIAPPPHASALAAVDYDHPWDGLVTQFKFHGALDLAATLAERLAEAFEHSGMERPSLLLPVPLSDARLRERGYNQAWELARRLARRLHCEADATLLLRLKHTPHQLALAPERRAANVRGAFAVEPRRLAEVRDRRITLVDDVLTTGATVAELSRTLLQAGAAQVAVWVVARTPRPNDLP